MYRTVRDDSGAWSLLKYAAVRASETAKSPVGTVEPKFPVEFTGMLGPSYTARMRPNRSTTAIAIVVVSAVAAAACTIMSTSAEVRKVLPGGGCGYCGSPDPEPPPELLEVPPPPQEENSKTSIAHNASAGSSENFANRPQRGNIAVGVIGTTPDSSYQSGAARLSSNVLKHTMPGSSFCETDTVHSWNGLELAEETVIAKR